METKIARALDKLTLEQTDRLLENIPATKIAGRKRRRITRMVFEKVGLKRVDFSRITLRLATVAAAVLLVFASLSLIGFDKVAATIRNLFTYIPGIGIVEKDEALFYMIDPVVERTEAQDPDAKVDKMMVAEIVRAFYENGRLTVMISVSGKTLITEDYTLFINDESVVFRKPGASMGISSGSPSWSWLELSVETKPPTPEDLYEIAIIDFPERLAFKMVSCLDFESIGQIGPTDIQNGISVTTAARITDNNLTVWCYPYRVSDTTNDKIVGYGTPYSPEYSASFDTEHIHSFTPPSTPFDTECYLATYSGDLYTHNTQPQIIERLVFRLSDTNRSSIDRSATLHIPYLTMQRREAMALKVALPAGYDTQKTDIAAECSLGTIKITEVRRVKTVSENEHDSVRIKFELESKDTNKVLYSFGIDGELDLISDPSTALSYTIPFDEETNVLEELIRPVDKDAEELTLHIANLDYYLLGEYVIPLDIE